jgi:hypothetical protein
MRKKRTWYRARPKPGSMARCAHLGDEAEPFPKRARWPEWRMFPTGRRP